jgi:hypothetical protein
MSLAALERELTRWLIRCGLEACDEAVMLEGFCDRLVSGGSAHHIGELSENAGGERSSVARQSVAGVSGG